MRNFAVKIEIYTEKFSIIIFNVILFTTNAMFIIITGHAHLTDFNIATRLQRDGLACSMSGTKPVTLFARKEKKSVYLWKRKMIQPIHIYLISLLLLIFLFCQLCHSKWNVNTTTVWPTDPILNRLVYCSWSFHVRSGPNWWVLFVNIYALARLKKALSVSSHKCAWCIRLYWWGTANVPLLVCVGPVLVYCMYVYSAKKYKPKTKIRPYFNFDRHRNLYALHLVSKQIRFFPL